MTELNFKGKEFVYNHHLAVPVRPLEVHPEKGIGEARLDGNLIIQGDNLHALKALLPYYAGKVDCIFIDPPYNTGNEGWAYNDNVRAPMIQEWLNSNPIGIDDGLRHDKWCAMMWPRLRLLEELLAEDGSFWMTIDDNEAHRAKLLLDEIFGPESFVSSISWQARYSVSSDAPISNSHNYILVYSKHPKTWAKIRNQLEKDETQQGRYSNPDGDPEGPWRAIPWDAAEERDASLSYPIFTEKGTERRPPKGRHWSGTIDKWEEKVSAGLAYFGQDGDGAPSYKKYLKYAGLVVPTTWWPHQNSGHTDEASKELAALSLGVPFETPKPVRLLSKIIGIATQSDSLVLDSYAGSGTTGHAVLKQNSLDGGDRRFILVQMDEENGANADKLTAARIRKVVLGYDFTGTQKTELFREKITWTSLTKADRLIEQVEKIENLHGHEYDTIKKSVKDGELIVTGEKKVKDWAVGLGGEFTYCTLGAPIELDKILTGETLPAWTALGGVLFHMATNRVFDPGLADPDRGYLGRAEAPDGPVHVWLIYRPDLDWLKTPEAALTLSGARTMAETAPGERHVVFAPARHVSRKMLDDNTLKVDFAPLPFALYRVERD